MNMICYGGGWWTPNMGLNPGVGCLGRSQVLMGYLCGNILGVDERGLLYVSGMRWEVAAEFVFGWMFGVGSALFSLLFLSYFAVPITRVRWWLIMCAGRMGFPIGMLDLVDQFMIGNCSRYKRCLVFFIL